MKAYPIEWHEDCLKNMKAHLAIKNKQLERAKVDHHQFTLEIYHREQQIARAQREGKISFDKTRYDPLG